MRRYLIVDDNIAFAENVAEILEDAGAKVDVVSSGARALELIDQHRYDVLVSDMKMPIMNGAELVHHIRRIDPGLPAIVMTAYTHDDDLQAARFEGVLAVLPKPAPIGLLLELCGVARRDGLVALVEDDRSLADNLCEALAIRGYSAMLAASLVETKQLGAVRPFAALVDLRIPGGPDGAAMSQLAVKFPGLPLFVVTGCAEVAPPEPHAGLFYKPFVTPVLMDAIARAYDQAL
jgi:CheY-like chemotaxis protein